MPRSSRSKSSKHSLKDAREFLDSVAKDRKGREENTDVRASNKLLEEYGSASKRRKDRADNGVNDRWNGGDDDRGDGSRKLKVRGDLQDSIGSRRNDITGERIYREVKKSSGKVEEKDKLDKGSSQEEIKGGLERDMKGKEGKFDRVVDNVEGGSKALRRQVMKVEAFDKSRRANQGVENAEASPPDEVQNLVLEKQLERRLNKRRDGSGDFDKHHDGFGDVNNRQLSSSYDISKDGRRNDDRHKDGSSRDKYHEIMGKDKRNRDKLQRDDPPARDNVSSRSADKHIMDRSDSIEIRHKKSKTDSDHDYGCYRGREHNQDQDGMKDRDRSRGQDLDRDHEGDWYRDRDRDKDQDWDRDRGHKRDCDCDRDRDRYRDCDHDHFRDRDHNLDRDHSSHFDNKTTRYKNDLRMKRSVHRDDYSDTKSTGVKVKYSDLENKFSGVCKSQSESGRTRSQLTQAHVDTVYQGTPSNSTSHVSEDGYRRPRQENLRYMDSLPEQRPDATSVRELVGVSRALERVSSYGSTEKPIGLDEKNIRELSAERSPSSKAPPMELVERSPSTTSFDRRYMNRSGVRRRFDADETGRRSSDFNHARDSSAIEDRLSRDLPSEIPLVDGSSLADPSLYNRPSQNNSSQMPPLPSSRAGVGSPSLLRSWEEESKASSSTHYRSADPNAVRGHGKAWRGVPNRSLALANVFIPFQHGPPHAGFEAMLPQFPPPPMFGVRPSTEFSHPGIPFHISDGDRLSGHLRPLGWQNMQDGSAPSPLNGWNSNNRVFRDAHHMYGAPDWVQNRHPMNGRGWEMSADIWEGQNGNVKMDIPSTSQKENHPVRASSDEDLTGKEGPMSLNEANYHGIQAKSIEIISRGTSPAVETAKSSHSAAHEKTFNALKNHEMTPVPSKISSDDGAANAFHFYLSKLDISTELASPELYKQCASLLAIVQISPPVDEDITKHINIVDGENENLGAAVPNISLSALFPALEDSVFQRTMDLYKKQRASMGVMQIVNTEQLASAAASDKVNVQENVTASDMENKEGSVPSSDQEMQEAISTVGGEAELVSAADEENLKECIPIPSQEMENHYHIPSLKKSEVVVQAQNHENSDQEMQEATSTAGAEAELVSAAGENLKVECITIPSQEMQNHNDMSSLQKSEMPVQAQDDVNSDEPMSIPSLENLVGTTLDEKLEAADENGVSSLSNASQNLALSPINGDSKNMLTKTTGSDYLCCNYKEEHDIGDAALMPVSNESELVNYSRIHHSPESTH